MLRLRPHVGIALAAVCCMAAIQRVAAQAGARPVDTAEKAPATLDETRLTLDKWIEIYSERVQPPIDRFDDEGNRIVQ